MVELISHRKWIIGILVAINAVYFMSKQGGKNGGFKFGLMGFDVPHVICISPSALSEPIEQLSFSTVIIILICASSHFLRQGVEEYVKDSLIKILLQEAIAAADLCGCCFELIIVADNFGVWIYGLYLFLLTIWWNIDWGSASASPNVQLEQVILGNQDSQLSLTKIWAELTGGIFVYKLIQYIWSLELIENHEKRAYEECTADLQVPIWQGFLVELAGTLISQLTSKIITELQPKYANVIQSFIGTSLVIAAYDHTGGYFNPVLATALKYGCEGNTFREHVSVYWVGCCLGSVLSVLLYYHTPMKSFFQKKAESRTRSETDNNLFFNKYD